MEMTRFASSESIPIYPPYRRGDVGLGGSGGGVLWGYNKGIYGERIELTNCISC